jgi:hypothetical protein
MNRDGVIIYIILFWLVYLHKIVRYFKEVFSLNLRKHSRIGRRPLVWSQPLKRRKRWKVVKIIAGDAGSGFYNVIQPRLKEIYEVEVGNLY